MRKIISYKNPCVFQGSKYLEGNKNYFEGWYFKNTRDNISISFIPGISINKNERKAFIQVITNDNSYNIDYDINEFEYSNNPFKIRIGRSYFTFDSIHIDIDDKKKNLIIYGDLEYTKSRNITTNWLSPNIMGIFSYIPYMECNHAIISMNNRINGSLSVNNRDINFNNGIGYIEKDWGCSFPKEYIWCQGNNFDNKSVSFMLSIADIPFKLFSFRGFICSLIIDNKEYRFATYNGSKIIKYDTSNNCVNIVLKKDYYLLEVNAICKDGFSLRAPVKGEMSKDIIESVSSEINIKLKKRKKVIFADKSRTCGLEVVRD